MRTARADGDRALPHQSILSVGIARLPRADDQELGPVDVTSIHGEHPAASLLAGHGCEPVGPWRAVDPGMLLDAGLEWTESALAAADGSIQVARVRQIGAGSAGAAPVPFSAKLTEAFSDWSRLNQAAVDDSTWNPPDAPDLLWHLRVLDFCAKDAADPLNEWQEDSVTRAEAALAEFDTWLCAQVAEHGWPRANIDTERVRELALNWAIGYAAPLSEPVYRDALDQAVARGDADPDHFALVDAAFA